MSLRPLAGILLLAVMVTGPRPARAWLAILSGEGAGNDVTEAAAVLPNGDVVVTGSVQGGATHEDLLAARLDGRSGRPLWRLALNGESTGDDPEFALDAGWDVAVDRRGDVFIGGTIQTPDGGPDATVLRLDGRTGRERWRTSMRVAGSSTFDLVHDVFVHPSGDVIAVVMVTDDFATHFFAVRLDGTSGKERWRRSLPFPSHWSNSAALDAGGSLVVAGLDYDLVADQPIATVLEISGDSGAVTWSRTLTGFALATLAVGPDGEVLVGGRQVRGDGADGTVLRLDGSAGEETWRVVLDGRDTGVDRVAVARDGAVTVAGTLGDDDARTVFVARHDAAAGAPLWRAVLDRAPSTTIAGGVSALALTRWGDVLAAITPVESGDSHRLVRLEAATGAERWTYDAGGDLSVMLATTPRGEVVSAGQTSWSEASGIDVAVFSLDGRTGRDPSRRERHPRPESVALRPWMCGL